MNKMHKIQERILKELEYTNKKSFSELQGEDESNKVAFHIGKLVERNLIEKHENKYKTTPQGQNLLPYIGNSNSKNPITVLSTVVFSKGKVFLQKKEDPLDPFTGCFRALTSRLKKDKRIEERAEELIEEKFETKPTNIQKGGAFDSTVEFKQDSNQHYLLFFVRAEIEEPTDDFYEIESIHDMKLIPGLENVIRKMEYPSNLPFFGEWDVRESKEGFEVDKVSF